MFLNHNQIGWNTVLIPYIPPFRTHITSPSNILLILRVEGTILRLPTMEFYFTFLFFIIRCGSFFRLSTWLWESPHPESLLFSTLYLTKKTAFRTLWQTVKCKYVMKPIKKNSPRSCLPFSFPYYSHLEVYHYGTPISSLPYNRTSSLPRPCPHYQSARPTRKRGSRLTRFTSDVFRGQILYGRVFSARRITTVEYEKGRLSRFRGIVTLDRSPSVHSTLGFPCSVVLPPFLRCFRTLTT